MEARHSASHEQCLFWDDLRMSLSALAQLRIPKSDPTSLLIMGSEAELGSSWKGDGAALLKWLRK